MKKILSLFLLMFSFLGIFNTVSANKCEFSNEKGASVTSMIDGCMEDTTVVAVKEDGTIEV
jgi:hypothetical protein